MTKWTTDDILLEKDENVFDYHSEKDYWYISDKGHIEKGDGSWKCDAERRHKIGNYCRNFSAMTQLAIKEEFQRILWRVSEQNDGPGQYYIMYNSKTGRWETLYVAYCGLIGPSFLTREDAQKGIDTIKSWLEYNGLSPEDVVTIISETES